MYYVLILLHVFHSHLNFTYKSPKLKCDEDKRRGYSRTKTFQPQENDNEEKLSILIV